MLHVQRSMSDMLTAMSVNVLAVASLGTCSAVASAANELAAQTFKYLALFAVSSLQRAFRTLLLPWLHLHRSAMGLIHVCYMCSSSISYMLTAMSVNVLAGASLGTCSAAV